MSELRRLLLTRQNAKKKLVNLFAPNRTDFPYTSMGVKVSESDDGTFRILGTCTGSGSCVSSLAYAAKVGHKYIIIGCPSGGSGNSYRLWTESGNAFPRGNRLSDEGTGLIKRALKDDSIWSCIYVYANTEFDGTQIWKPMVFDLTDYFGDGNEPTTVSAFYAYFGATSIDDFPYIKP